MRRSMIILVMLWAAAGGPGLAEDPGELLRQAEAALAAGNPEGAAEALERLLAIDPDHWEAHCRLGDVRLAAGLYPEAEKAFRKAVAIQPESGVCHSGLAKSLLLQERLEEAEAPLLRALELLPSDAAILFNLGRLQEMTGQFEEAVQTYARFLESTADGNRTHSVRLRMARLLSGLLRPLEAAEHYAAFLERAGEDREVRQEYATALMQASRFAEALAEYEKVIGSGAVSPGTLGNAGALYLMRGDLPAAIELLEQAVSLDPGDAAHRIALATALARSNDHGRAVEVLQELVKMDATSERGYFLLGRSLMQLGRVEEARQAFERHRAIHEEVLRERMSRGAQGHP